MVSLVFLVPVISFLHLVASMPLKGSPGRISLRDGNSKPAALQPSQGRPNHGNDNTTTVSMQTYDEAGGGPSNTPPPSTLTQDAADNLQFAIYLLNLESAFYHAGLANMTSPSDPEAWGSGTLALMNEFATLTSLAAQIDVHITTLSDLLSYFGVSGPPACSYSWPSVANIEAFSQATQNLSAVSLSTLLSVDAALATSDPTLVATLTPMLTTHARANAFFRTTTASPPSPAPFDTSLPPAWAFAFLNPFISSCNSTYKLPTSLAPLPANPPSLTPLPQSQSSASTNIPPASSTASSSSSARTSTLTFTVSLSEVGFDISPPVSVYLAWLTGTAAGDVTYTTATVLEGGLIRSDVPAGVHGTVWVALVGKDDPTVKVQDLVGTWVAGPAGVDVT